MAEKVVLAGNAATAFQQALTDLGIPYINRIGNIAVDPALDGLGAGDMIIYGFDGTSGPYYDYNSFLNAGGRVFVAGGSNSDAYRAWVSLYFNLTHTSQGWHTDGPWTRTAVIPQSTGLPATYTFQNSSATYHMLGIASTTNTTVYGQNSEGVNVGAIRTYANGGSMQYMALDVGPMNYQTNTDYITFTRPLIQGALNAVPAPTNAAPTDIALSTTSVAENQLSGTTVATITGTDPDAGQSATLTFSLVSGTGSTDNASFSIAGTSLKTAAAFNFETKSSYSIRLRATDSATPGLTYEEAFTISVTNVNEAPTDITLTPATIPENNTASATVGALAAVDEDAADSHSFSLVAGAGDTNNADFSIDGTSLKLTPSANFETQSSYSVRVQATDALGAIFAKPITVSIGDVNEMPSFAKGADQSLPALIMVPQSISGWATAINDGDSSATQTLTFNVSVTSGAALFTTAPAISADGTLTYRLGGAVGTAVVSVTLTDDASINGTAALTTGAQTFSITSQEAASTGHIFDAAAGLNSGGFIYRPMPGVINNASQISFKAMGKINSGGFTSANDSMLITNVSGDFQVIGQEATAAPGSGSLSGSFNNLVLSAGGQTVASERFLGATISTDNGYVVSGDGLSLEMLSREGSTATEGGIFTGHTGRHAVDDEERIYFPGTLSGVPTTKNSGTWYDEAGTIAVLAKEGDDVGPVTGDLAWLGNFSAPLSAAGEGAAFVAALQNNPDIATQKTPVAKNAAIFSGAPESLELVARKGDLIPTVGKLGSFSAVSRGGSGDHAFISLLTLSTAAPVVAAANDQVIMAEIGGVKHLVARENTTELVGSLKPVRLGNVYMTSAGEVIYQAWLTGSGVTLANDSVLCRWTVAGGNEVLAREGDSAPGTGSTYLAFQAFSVSSGGAVVLQSTLGNSQIALMRALPGAGLTVAVKTGTTLTYNGASRSILSLGIHQTGAGTGGGGGGLGAAINDEGAIFTVLSIGASEYVTRVYRP